MKQKLRRIYENIKLNIGFRRDLKAYKAQFVQGNRSLPNIKLHPQLHDKTSATGFDAHYVYQGPWVFEKLLKAKPKKHIDIGSYIGYMGFFAMMVPTEFVDIRPTGFKFGKLIEKEGSLMNLPYKNSSISSLSCLHVLEHIGLGRYGDELDIDGTDKAIAELSRVMKKDGDLYISVPSGKEAVYFNAHRVFNSTSFVKKFKGFTLKEVSAVLDDGSFVRDCTTKLLNRQEYACGLYWLRKD